MIQYLTEDEQGYDIDSVQNGILLSASLHRMWDCWALSINPVPGHFSISSHVRTPCGYHAFSATDFLSLWLIIDSSSLTQLRIYRPRHALLYSNISSKLY